jgi:hypothetical protein
MHCIYQQVEHTAARADIFFLGSLPKANRPIHLNGNTHITCAILKLVVVSVAAAELGALFLNARKAKILQLTLHELGHSQSPTPIHINNMTAVGIVNSTVKRQRSRAMEIQYFWLLDQYTQENFAFQHHPDQENLGDYPSKQHTGTGHQNVRPYYLHTQDSPTYLPRAVAPSTQRGCAEILGDRYHKLVPLPVIQTRALAAPAISAPAISITNTYPIDTFPSQRVTNVNRGTTQSIGCKLALMLSTQATRLHSLIIT